MTLAEIDRLSYYDCFCASLRLKEELSKINGKLFFCGDDLFKIRAIISSVPYVKVTCRKKGHKTFAPYFDREICDNNTVLGVVKDIVEWLPKKEFRTLGLEPLTVEQLAHYLES